MAARWLRVLSDDPCLWCIEQAAEAESGEAQAAFRRHEHCSCTAEPVFDRSVQPPSFDDRAGAALSGDAARGAAPVSVKDGAVGRGSLTKGQLDAVDGYVASGRYRDINTGLRTGRTSRAVDREVARIDEALAKSPLQADVQVSRGVGDGRAVFGEAWDESMVGVEWTELGYLSTATRQETVERFARANPFAPGSQPGLLQIHVPGGVRGIDADSFEQELLLERGLQLRVVSDTGPGSSPRRIGVEVVK